MAETRAPSWADAFQLRPFRLAGILVSVEHKPADGQRKSAVCRLCVNTPFGHVGDECDPTVYAAAEKLLKNNRTQVLVDVIPEPMKQRSEYEKGYAYRLKVTAIGEFVEAVRSAV